MGLVTFTGQIGVGSIITLIVAVLGFAGIYLQVRGNRQHTERVEGKVDEVNRAVNGVTPDRQPLVKNVQDIHDQLTSHAHE